MAVENELDNLNIKAKNVELGKVDLGDYDLSDEQLTSLSERLVKIGFEIIDDKKSKIIERIKTFIIEQVHYHNHQENINLSTSLAEDLSYDYNYLSNLFSSIEGITIEQFHIQQKIERVKELLVYDELSLNEIAYEQGYSSAAISATSSRRLQALHQVTLKS